MTVMFCKLCRNPTLETNSLILDLAGDVHFDDAEVYTVDSPTGRNLLWVAVHELGHSIGLDHSGTKGAVMYPWYQSTEGKDFVLTLDDVRGAQSIYGKSTAL